MRSQKNGAVSKVNKKSISHHTWAKRTPSAAATVPVSHALTAVRFSCLLRGRGVSFQDGAAAVKGSVYIPPLPMSLKELRDRITHAMQTITADMLHRVWDEFDYRADVCRVTQGAHIEGL